MILRVATTGSSQGGFMDKYIDDIRKQLEDFSDIVMKNMEANNDFGCDCLAKINKIADDLWKHEQNKDN